MKLTDFFSFAPIVAACSILTLPLSAEEWTQYRGPNHDGTSSEKMPLWPKDGFKPLWEAPTQNGFSSFVIKDGRAFTLVSRDIEGAPREVLIALQTDTGKEIWAQPVGIAKYEGGGDSGTKDNSGGDGPRSTPAADGKLVYVISGDLVLGCFNAASGEKVWSRNIIKENSGRNISWKNAASPLIEGDLVLLAGGGEGQSLLGINKLDGKVAWKGESDKMTHASPIAATILGTRQAIFLTQKGLVSVEPHSGKVLWRHPFKFNVSTAASPVVENDIVYCSAGYGVGSTAIRLSKTGDSFKAEELWRVTGDKIANHWSTPVVKDGYLYGMFQFKQYGDGPVKCIELKTGKEMWSKPGFGPGHVIMVGGKLLALSDAGELVLIDPNPEKYLELGRFQAVSGKCWTSPAFSDGRVYVRSTKEGAAFDLSTKLSRR
jgi:outer membrane protein assembly factor BamB